MLDDKKKIIILAVAVIVAIGLIVLIVVTRRGGGTTNQPALPPTPSSTVGTPGGKVRPGGGGEPGPSGNASGTGSSTGGTPNAFLPKYAPTENSGFARTDGGIYVAPGTPQPIGYVPKPINVSDSYLISQITSSSIADILRGTGVSMFTTSTVLKMASDYLASLHNIPTDPAKLQAILNNVSNTVATFPTPQQMAQQFLNSSSTTNALNSLVGFQGITADQMSFLQSLSAATSTISLNQNLLNLGSQNTDFINNVLANASGTISVDQLRTLLQQFNLSTSAQCAQIQQQMQTLQNMAASAGGLGMDVIWQYLPMQSCAASTSTSGANG